MSSRETALHYLESFVTFFESRLARRIPEIEILQPDELPKEWLAGLPEIPPGSVRTIGRVDGILHVYTSPFGGTYRLPDRVLAYLTDEDMHRLNVRLLAIAFEQSAARAATRRKPNKAPEPTPGSVTPRATQAFSK